MCVHCDVARGPTVKTCSPHAVTQSRADGIFDVEFNCQRMHADFMTTFFGSWGLCSAATVFAGQCRRRGAHWLRRVQLTFWTLRPLQLQTNSFLMNCRSANQPTSAELLFHTFSTWVCCSGIYFIFHFFHSKIHSAWLMTLSVTILCRVEIDECNREIYGLWRHVIRRAHIVLIAGRHFTLLSTLRLRMCGVTAWPFACFHPAIQWVPHMAFAFFFCFFFQCSQNEEKNDSRSVVCAMKLIIFASQTHRRTECNDAYCMRLQHSASPTKTTTQQIAPISVINQPSCSAICVVSAAVVGRASLSPPPHLSPYPLPVESDRNRIEMVALCHRLPTNRTRKKTKISIASINNGK